MGRENLVKKRPTIPKELRVCDLCGFRLRGSRVFKVDGLNE